MKRARLPTALSYQPHKCMHKRNQGNNIHSALGGGIDVLTANEHKLIVGHYIDVDREQALRDLDDKGMLSRIIFKRCYEKKTKHATKISKKDERSKRVELNFSEAAIKGALHKVRVGGKLFDWNEPDKLELRLDGPIPILKIGNKVVFEHVPDPELLAELFKEEPTPAPAPQPQPQPQQQSTTDDKLDELIRLQTRVVHLLEIGNPNAVTREDLANMSFVLRDDKAKH
jgi:hypothetical protein